MKLKLIRIAKREKYTIGHLYRQDPTNKQWVKLCDTIEDKDRGLKQSMSLTEILRRKVKHETAIPTGIYEVRVDIISPKFKAKPLYDEFCGGRVPRIMGVKGFDGILMHSGYDQDSSSGCPIVGENKVVGKVINSWGTFKRIYPYFKAAANRGEKITIEII